VLLPMAASILLMQKRSLIDCSDWLCKKIWVSQGASRLVIAGLEFFGPAAASLGTLELMQSCLVSWKETSSNKTLLVFSLFNVIRLFASCGLIKFDYKISFFGSGLNNVL